MQPQKRHEPTSYAPLKSGTMPAAPAATPSVPPAQAPANTTSPISLASKGALEHLHARRDAHPLWSCRLLRAFAAGQLTRDDLRYVFSQYYFYSRSFTRYIAALMARCESDFFRARLSENLWEEGGGARPEDRHAQIFRAFLRDALDIADPDSMPQEDFTAHFAHQYLEYCLKEPPSRGSAFLSLGTEGIVGRMYGVFVEGLRKAGIAEEHLKFFRLHMEVDDEHAITLEQLMASYAGEPGWLDGCARAADEALTLRARFFDNLYEGVRHRRVQGKLAAIQDRGSLAPPLGEGTLVHHNGEPLEVLYENVIDRLNIAFDVLRLPFRGETIDPRIVRIAPYKNNEKHKHAHETLYYILSGRGRITIDDHVLEVSAGDLAFVPRWSLHQTQNLTGGDMIVLAVTDANLTDIAYVGRQNPRLKGAAERG